MSDQCTIDSFGPLPLVHPSSVAELGDVVRRAADEGQALYPIGGGTMLDLGLPPVRPGIGVPFDQLAQVVDYPARDMTVTVQAGITLSRLQELLRTENQRLPVDVPKAEQATLGGAVACNVSGPRRLGFGTLRDYVIGISVVNDLGHEVKAGGRVVKNVAGYDLCKLHIGALGTLGIVTQVTLKLRPLPEEHALVALGVETAALEELLDDLHRSRTRPVCLELLNRAAVRRIGEEARITLPATPWVVFLGFEENREAVAWQVQQLVKEVPSARKHGLSVWVDAPAEPLWQALVEFPASASVPLTFKANLLPHALPAFCRQADAEEVLLQAHAGNGIVLGHWECDGTLDRAQTYLEPLRASAISSQGNLVIPHCPTEWKKTLPIWGAPRGDAWLMKKVKDALDPRDLFNPGRLDFSNSRGTGRGLLAGGCRPRQEA